jgi:hypothetical protein
MDRRAKRVLASMRFKSAIHYDWLLRLGVPAPTPDTEIRFWNKLAEEVTRWTGVSLSAQEIQGVLCTDLDTLIREAVNQRESYLSDAIPAANRRAADIAKLNPTDREAADFIARNPGCAGKSVASTIGVTTEHFKRRIAPKLKPFGLYNYDGYFMPALRAR